MNDLIQFKGFSPSPVVKDALQRDIWDLLEFCPSDSVADAEITRDKNDSYQAKVSIRFVGGEFVSTGWGNSAQQAFRLNMNRLYDHIKDWRQTRFQESSPAFSLEDYVSDNTQFSWARNRTAFEEEKFKVLVVDDESTSVRTLLTCLDRLDCEVKVVQSGHDAVEEIIANPYDLMFLDWRMPDMTGGDAIVSAEAKNSVDPVLDYQWSALRLPVVTYSGCTRKEIILPQSHHFRFIDHWEKNMPLPRLISKTARVVSGLRAGAQGPMRQ